MLHLFKLEWKKLYPNRAFKIITILYVLLLPLLFFTVKSATKPNAPRQLNIIEPLYKFPLIWESMAYWASWLAFFLLVYLSVWIVTSEYNSKTMRQNIITGLSRKNFLIAKFLLIISLAGFATLYMSINALTIGYITGGYGDPWGEETAAIGRFFVQTIFYMSFAFMLAIIFKKSGLTMIIFFAYVMIIERIIRYLVFLNIFENLSAGSYFPASAAWDVVPMYMVKHVPDFSNKVANIILPYDIAVSLTIFFSFIFLLIAAFVFLRRDL
ncbi:hypothetical protein OAK19_02800 [Aureispira]|nr:hypothetical protein [Aureispira sp.]